MREKKGMREYAGERERKLEKRLSPPGVLLPSELISRCRCMKLSKTDDNDRTQK